jgi:hypothetical protein
VVKGRGLTTKGSWVKTPTVYWMDVSYNRNYIERNITIKVAKSEYSTTKTKFKK